MAKGQLNKRYAPEFKKMVIETMLEEKLNYTETARRFEISNQRCIKNWERIYLAEGEEGFAVERRGRKKEARQAPNQAEKERLAELERLRAENEYLRQHRTKK